MSLSPSPCSTYRPGATMEWEEWAWVTGRLSQELSRVLRALAWISWMSGIIQNTAGSLPSVSDVLAQLWCSQGAMPRGLWTTMRSRKREEGWDKEGQVVLSNIVLMHSLRQIRALCGTQQVSSQRALTESVDISDDLSPWKASFSSGLSLEKQICIVLSECRCIHLLLVLPSKLAVSVCHQTVLLWAPSVVCSQHRLWEAFCVPGIRETPLQDPFPKCSSFQSRSGQRMAALAEGMGQSRSRGHRGTRLCPPAQSRTSSLVLLCCCWMSLNCKWIWCCK